MRREAREKKRRTWVGIFGFTTLSLGYLATTHERFVDTAKCPRLRRGMREQAAILLRSCLE